MSAVSAAAAAAAISPYAPPRRNSLLRRPLSEASSSSRLSRNSSSVSAAAATSSSAAALLLLVARFWDVHPAIRRLLVSIRERIRSSLLSLSEAEEDDDDDADRRGGKDRSAYLALAVRFLRFVTSVLVYLRKRASRLLPPLLLPSSSSGGLVERRRRPPSPALRDPLDRSTHGRPYVWRLLSATSGAAFGSGDDGDAGVATDVREDGLASRPEDGEGRTTTTDPMSSSSSSTPPSSSSSSPEVESIRRNLSSIDSVLLYWFGRFDPEEARKNLWTIPSSSVEKRKAVDKEIAEKFEGLLLELAGRDDDDARNEESGEGEGGGRMWREWTTDVDLYGIRGKIAAIIVLDQVSRHVRRHRESIAASDDDAASSMRPLPPLPSQAKLDSLALRTSRLLTSAHAAELSSGGMLPVSQYVFGLMPYRHASTVNTVGFAQKCAGTAAEIVAQDGALVKRFQKATNRRLAVLMDEERRVGKGGGPNSSDENGGVRDDVDERLPSSGYRDEDILEAVPFDADAADGEASEARASHPVVEAVESFLNERGVFPVDGSDGEGEGRGRRRATKERRPRCGTNSIAVAASATIAATADDAPATSPSSSPTTIVISLSGGVDSNVLLSVLVHLRDVLRYDLALHAAHVDYGNRPESSAEASYVAKYCESLGGVACRIRRIDEVTRGGENADDRDEYERRSREIRYEFYRSVVQEAREEAAAARSAKATTEDKDGREDGRNEEATAKVAVMLGHHRGDLRENVLSNAHRGSGPLDLSGMTSISTNDGVLIHRPLLSLEKSVIYDYAHRYGVPYFKDTTPSWSTRGKLRNRLLPLLEEIYGEGSMKNLSDLAVESDEARELMRDVAFKPFLDRVRRYPMGISFETAEWKDRGTFFWKLVLREALHDAGRGMFTDKCVESFLERIRSIDEDGSVSSKKRSKGKDGSWLQCRKDYAVYLESKSGRVYVFHPDSFPFRREDQYCCAGQELDYGDENATSIGPWTIAANVVPSSEASASKLVSRKAVPDIETLMGGRLVYHLAIPVADSHRRWSEDNEEEEERAGGDSDRQPPRSAAASKADGAPTMTVLPPLAFVSGYAKKDRPRAWKNVDARIQSTLPLVGRGGSDNAERGGNGVDAERTEYGREWRLVRVTMVREGAAVNGVAERRTDDEREEERGREAEEKEDGDRPTTDAVINTVKETKGDELERPRCDSERDGDDRVIASTNGVDHRRAMTSIENGPVGKEEEGNGPPPAARGQSDKEEKRANELWDSLIRPFVQGDDDDRGSKS